MRWPILTLALLLPAPGGAQVIEGRVIDAGTRRPIAFAAVRLLKADVQLLVVASDSSGRFRLRAPDAGRYKLSASRIGYADATTNLIDLQREQTINAELQMSSQAVKAAPLTVEANRVPYLEDRGFYDRKAQGMGDFMTGDQIRRRNAHSLVDLLRSMRSVKIQRAGMRQEVYLSGTNCFPQIVVDGMTLRQGGRLPGTVQPLDDLVNPQHIEGIEVYRPGGLPPQWEGPNAACGVIVIWTKH